MSASDEWVEWHLTPRGWEAGNKQIDFRGFVPGATPEDRVATYQYYEYMSSVYSEMNIGHKLIWESGNKDEIKRLLDKFGAPPTGGF